MQKLTKKLSKNPIIFVTRDPERATGLGHIPGYFIITNHSPLDKELIKKYNKNIFIVNSTKILDTYELLQNLSAKKIINSFTKPSLLVFKNTPYIENICLKNNWHLINPSSTLANIVEEKISQVEWLGKLKKYLPKTKIGFVKNIGWLNKKMILQFNRSHTGSGTMLIDDIKKLNELKNRFPNREIKITPVINGPVFTSNNVVAKDTILAGNISYQITGIFPFTQQKFSTVGNDWFLPNKILTEKLLREYLEIVCDVGKKLRRDGWLGLFGIDVILDEENQKLFLLEINARQPASATFESELQNTKRNNFREGITVFQAHLMSLLNFKLSNFELVKIKDGYQILQRYIASSKLETNKTKIIKKLEKNGFKVIPYNNRKENTDFLRIQGYNEGLMKKHNGLNNLGQKIIYIIKKNI